MRKGTIILLTVNNDTYTFVMDKVMNVNRYMKVLYGTIKEMKVRYAIVLQQGKVVGMYPSNNCYIQQI